VASAGHSSMLTARSEGGHRGVGRPFIHADRAVRSLANNLVLFLFCVGRMIKDDEPNRSLSSMRARRPFAAIGSRQGTLAAFFPLIARRGVLDGLRCPSGTVSSWGVWC
jgi:hypothetical protein